MTDFGRIAAMQSATTLTDLIRRAREGDEQALKAFFDVTYEDLRRMARARLLKTGRGPMLDTTSLVHESYLRFANADQLQITDRAHFFRYQQPMSCAPSSSISRERGRPSAAAAARRTCNCAPT